MKQKHRSINTDNSWNWSNDNRRNLCHHHHHTSRNHNNIIFSSRLLRHLDCRPNQLQQMMIWHMMAQMGLGAIIIEIMLSFIFNFIWI